jgi:hypothetical protein
LAVKRKVEKEEVVNSVGMKDLKEEMTEEVVETGEMIDEAAVQASKEVAEEEGKFN